MKAKPRSTCNSKKADARNFPCTGCSRPASTWPVLRKGFCRANLRARRIAILDNLALHMGYCTVLKIMTSIFSKHLVYDCRNAQGSRTHAIVAPRINVNSSLSSYILKRLPRSAVPEWCTQSSLTQPVEGKARTTFDSDLHLIIGLELCLDLRAASNPV